MSENENTPLEGGSSKLGVIADLAKTIPIYQDALQPMMQETGKALSVIGRSVNVALAPIRGLVWGAEKVEEWLCTTVAEKMKKVPAENIVSPDLSIAGPTIEALKFSGHKPELASMFASLLAGAMQIDLRDKVHPSFVEKIKLMTPFEAMVFKEIAGYIAMPTIDISSVTPNIDGSNRIIRFFNPKFFEIAQSLSIPPANILDFIQSATVNLDGLGLVEFQQGLKLTSPENEVKYLEIIDGELCRAFAARNVTDVMSHLFERSYVRITKLGEHFNAIVNAA